MLTNFLLGFASPVIYVFIFGFLVLCGVGNPVPEDTILIAAGYLAHEGVANVYYMLVICYFGIIGGDLLLYYFGHRYGQKVIEHPKILKLVPVERVDRIRKGFHRWGHWMVFFARFLVGFRTPTFLLSGVMRLPLRVFVLFDCLGALLSVPIFVGLGYLFGEHVAGLKKDISRAHSWLIAALIIGIAAFFIWRWIKSRREEVEEEPIFLWEPHPKSGSTHTGTLT